MLFHHARVVPVLFMCLMFSASSGARNHVVTIKGGDLHLRGELAEGSCEVSTGSRDMSVDMGQYRNSDFQGVGSLSSVLIPFELHLTGCNPALASAVGVSFYGMTDPKDPDVFLVSSGVSGRDGYSGLGLLIADETGSQVIPDRVSDTFVPVTASDVVLHFTARYRTTSREPSPGELRSEVSFRLVYP
ncbi:fimbrial protein [Enterobacter sp. MALB-1]|uniref:fimbrial protein n=1 Tax=Enterobacter sp. MALB-1 TaxID=3153561 RepID=UPI0034DB1197